MAAQTALEKAFRAASPNTASDTVMTTSEGLVTYVRIDHSKGEPSKGTGKRNVYASTRGFTPVSGGHRLSLNVID